jgi:hypothetical protein
MEDAARRRAVWGNFSLARLGGITNLSDGMAGLKSGITDHP